MSPRIMVAQGKNFWIFLRISTLRNPGLSATAIMAGIVPKPNPVIKIILEVVLPVFKAAAIAI